MSKKQGKGQDKDQAKKANIPRRIVCVDDDFDVRQIVRDSFQRSEFGKEIVVATCGSGQEMISRLRELQPELILVDIMMPKMNGLDMIQTLRAQVDGQNIPVVFLTGKTKLKMEDEYRNLGVIGVVYKPFDPMKLADDIFKMWQSQGIVSDGEGQVLTELMDQDDQNTFKNEN